MVRSRRLCNALISWTLLSLIVCSSTAFAQQISTNTPVPPLQWINLTPHLTGSSAPPPLKDASIGYDETSRTLLIFGGESAAGNVQQETYLLNLSSLAWFPPSYNGGTNEQRPPARSAALTGYDSAASYRTAQIIIGGMGSNGEALSDVWEFDYTYQFWQNVVLTQGGPSARYGAVGGSDSRTPDIPSNAASPNNSFYLAGGIDGSSVSPLSDVWRLNVTGTLSPNNQNDLFASWEQVPITTSDIPSKIGAAGAVVLEGSNQLIAAIGGCTSSTMFNINSSCAQPDGYMISTDTESVSRASICPAPRIGATVVANFNGLSGSDFDSQVFLMLGLFNESLWSDGGGLARGEVDVLNINTGDWARILPAGDPTSNPPYPSPRQGAVGLSFGQTLVGSSPSIASDTIVFGGVDASGNYLQELWILRAYNAQLTQSNQSWSGSGNGPLVGGVDATGQGVTIQYMSECASALSPQATQTYSTPTATSTGTSGAPLPTGSASPVPYYNTSVAHKALSAVSVAVALPAVILLRLSLPTVSSIPSAGGHNPLYYSSAVLGLAAYGLGVAGLATSFTTITSTMTSIAKRSSSSNVLTTAHGRAGLALFIGFYGLLPLLFALSACFKRSYADVDNREMINDGDPRHRVDSATTAEKEELFPGRVSSPIRKSADRSSNERRTSEHRPRVRSWGGLGSLGISGRRSSDSAVDSAGASAPSRGSFEVTNRPARTRRASGNSLAAFSDPKASGTPRNLSDLSWFERRRSLNTVGEVDYALGHVGPRDTNPSTPGTAFMDMTSTSGLMVAPHLYAAPELPRPFDIFLHVLFHALLLGLCVLSLVALWLRAPKATFGVFLAATIVFYIVIVTLAWYGRPRISVLSVLFSRLRGDPSPAVIPAPSRPLSTAGSEVPFPTSAEHRSPYQHHHPPFRTTMSVGLDEYPASASHGHGTTEVDDDDDEDEDSRQRRIEEELSRRDVSIVTVPKRKLFLTNPEEYRG